MPIRLIKGDQGAQVRELQTLLMDKGFLTDEEISGATNRNELGGNGPEYLASDPRHSKPRSRGKNEIVI